MHGILNVLYIVMHGTSDPRYLLVLHRQILQAAGTSVIPAVPQIWTGLVSGMDMYVQGALALKSCLQKFVQKFEK